jgi:cellulose biosynthesis protein BcsQ
VLLVDADPQGSLTGACGLDAASDGITPNLASAVNGTARIDQACYPLADRLSRLPATGALADTESAMSGKPAYQTLLKFTHHNAAIEEIKASGLPMLQPIGRSVKVQESSAAGLPITQYDPEGMRAQEYQQLGREIEKWLRNQ